VKLFVGKNVLCFFFSLIVFACNNVSAQEMPVKYLGLEQGLSNNAVTCITQDSYGFMWMGTYDGLNRYDGYEFKNFRNVFEDKGSLINNHIKAIKAVADRVYVGTEKGLMFFDYSDSRFHSLYCYNESHQLTKIQFNINQIVADKNGNAFVANGTYGLLKFKPTDTIGGQITGNNIAPRYGVQALSISPTGQIWAVVNGVGLFKYNSAANKLEIESDQIKDANCLAIDSQPLIWIGMNDGLINFSPGSGKLTRFDNTHKLSNTNIYNLTVSQNGDIWMATNGGGVNVWDNRLQKLTYIKAGENSNLLRSSAITSVYEDDEHRKWIATLRGGVNIIDSKNTPFHLFTHDAFNKNSVINNFILSFCEDGSGNVWIGTDGGGLSRWDVKRNVFSSYQHQAGAGSISSNFVVSIVEDFNKQIWVATFNGGIDAYNSKTNAFRHYPCFNPVTGINEKNFWKLYEDSKHHLWASSTWGGALYLYNREKDQFDLFDKVLTNIHTLYEDHSGRLWGGNYDQLIRIDAVNKKHKYYNIGQAIRAITEDKAFNLWVGTDGGGLINFHPQTEKVVRYTEKMGLSNNSILNILVDNKGALWCSTYNGLSNFNVKSQKFVNYFASDGLQSNQFNYNAALKLKSGNVLFGGIKGFNLFNPDSIATFVHVPRLQLTDIKVNNTSIQGNENYSHHQPLNALKKITIPFDEATMVINYTALEFSFPGKISYAYYLEGWDHNWNYVKKLKSAYYTRLNEGTYHLKIRATNTDGVWNPNPLVLEIVVLPPWYRSWWAYMLYTLSVGFLIYSYWTYRKRQIRLQYEVEIANLKVEKEKEINEKKLSFFTNVSHEFRTPLTLIINPVKELLRQDKQHSEELNIVYRNARRLLGLMDHLMLFRKTESENASMKIAQMDFAAICREIYICFTHQAKIKHINYTIETGSSPITVYGDREKIEIALFNLISNALKFTPENGIIQVVVKEDADSVYFEIADSGIGITTDIGEKLFDKFYQVKDANSLKTGFGIGLYLVKTFIEAHKGTINYQSTSGTGTTFTLRLPKGNEHLKAFPIQNDVKESPFIEEMMDIEQVVSEPAEIIGGNLKMMISDRQSVLVIDDNQEIRAYVKKIFSNDYTLYEAENGAQGLEMVRKYLPDVVISDIVMPELNGLELCKIIKQDSALSHIPIILLTGESAPEIKLQGIEEGAVDFISKPFDKDLLVARVKGIIKNKRELQNYFFSEVTLKGKNRNVSEQHKDFLYKCIEVIEASIMDSEVDVNAIADKMGMSYPNLYKKLKAITGYSINSFVRYVRLQKAAELMINTNCNVNEAALRVGINDIKYFREHFNKQFGLNPSEFIKQHRIAFQKSYSLKKRG
jgi:signal transduction histidine kinase/ligand-binding sensor domain-containing protein/CheY-like chemotaxis protein